MNEADSERIAGYYQSKGWQPGDNYQDADEIIINTCSVRASAEHRVFGLVNNIRKLKVQSSKCKTKIQSAKIKKLKIILTGCMLRLPLRTLKEKLPGVDEFVRSDFYILHSPLSIRASGTHAYVPISNGCNNFCSYCVVPYARGREISRPFDEIVCEVGQLAKRGYKEITLLGQNVNSYGKEQKNLQFTIYNLQFKTPFAQLLYSLNNIDGIEKISFLTSNPWDLDDEIILAMKLPKIDRNLHLAVQSGDDDILKKMNRKYTAGQFVKLTKKIKKEIPEIKFSTDIIVGFPSETEKQFRNTVGLCQKVGFTKAYINKYSPREGTAAYRLKDDVSPQEKKRRWLILEKMINRKLS